MKKPSFVRIARSHFPSQKGRPNSITSAASLNQSAARIAASNIRPSAAMPRMVPGTCKKKTAKRNCKYHTGDSYGTKGRCICLKDTITTSLFLLVAACCCLAANYTTHVCWASKGSFSVCKCKYPSNLLYTAHPRACSVVANMHATKYVLRDFMQNALQVRTHRHYRFWSPWEGRIVQFCVPHLG